MKKITKILLSIALIFSVLPFSVIIADDNDTGTIYYIETSGDSALSNSITFDNSANKSSGNSDWGSYFGMVSYSPDSDQDSINEIKIEKWNSANSKYDEIAKETNINVTIVRTSSAITITPSSSNIFTNIVINGNKADGTVSSVVMNLKSISGCSDSTKYKISVTFGLPPTGDNNNQGNENNDDSTFVLEEQTYKVGFGNTSEDGQTLHIDGGSDIEIQSEVNTLSLNLMIGVGKYDSGNVSGSASNEIISKIFETLVVKDYSGNEITNYESYSFTDKPSQTTINTRNYHCVFPNSVGNYPITLCFTDPSGVAHTVNYGVSVKNTIRLNFNVDNINKYLDGTEITGDTKLAKLNTILSSKTNLAKFVGDEKLTNDAVITFNFEPTNTYSGTITVNCYESGNDSYKIYFKGGDGNYDRADYISKYIYGQRATLNGNIINHGGLLGVSNMNFVNSETGSAKTVNGLECSSTVDGIVPDIWEVEGCTFTGYNYAVSSNGRGLISGLKFCTFTNNNVGIYVNTAIQNSYSDSLYNTFVNNKVAIEIENVGNKNSYDYVISKNYFFNNSDSYKDYEVNAEGTFFFINSYYGSTYTSNSASITNANYRDPVVNMGSSSEVVTGPLIRYPESNVSVLGFNTSTTGGSNKLNNGASYKLHTEELDNSTNKVEIDIYDQSANKDLGSLEY